MCVEVISAVNVHNEAVKCSVVECIVYSLTPRDSYGSCSGVCEKILVPETRAPPPLTLDVPQCFQRFQAEECRRIASSDDYGVNVLCFEFTG